ncbi:MAG: discoidin domain-containing protein, partial [Clostridia bacterium]|nr:discoidin domain-containing protein [Clostridia bacterium]
GDELLDGLHRYGIRLQLYIHSTVGDTMTDAEREATGYNDGSNGYLKWNNFVNEVFDCLTKRYGNEMDSYYIDMIFDEPFMHMIDIPRLRALFERNCPDTVITGNGEANDLVDFSSREDCSVYVSSEFSRYSTAVQHVILLPNHKEKAWWSTVPDSHGDVVDYSPEHLYRALVLNAGSNVCGGGVAFGFGPYCDRGFEPGVERSMRALWDLIRPVGESIKKTLPSRSWVTPSGIRIVDLDGGFTAVTSRDGKYEYLHVLCPGRTGNLNLRKPLDGRKFGNPVNLRSGEKLVIAEKADGGYVISGIHWDPLDTVICLEVAEQSEKTEFPTETLPNCLVSATSDSEAEGYAAGNLVDGDGSTFWMSRSGNIHSVVFALDKIRKICGLKIIPVNSTAPEMLVRHVAIYSVFVSKDGRNWRAVATGEMKRSTAVKHICFPSVECRYIRLQCGPDWFIGYEHKIDAVSGVEIIWVKD